MKHYVYLESENNFEMGEEWLRRKDYEKAELHLKKAIELNPRFMYSYIVLAEVYARKKDFTKAGQILNKASKIDPEFHKLHHLMAKYAFKAGDYPLALRHIDRALSENAQPLYEKSRRVIDRALKNRR